MIWPGIGTSGPGPTGIAAAGGRRGAAAGPAAVGGAAENRTVVRRSAVPAGMTPSVQRRSAGPPRAGSGRAEVNASSARVDDRRGIASCATVTFTSCARGGRARRNSTIAAPLKTPRTRPRARKPNSVDVTLPASRGSSSSAVATPSPRQRSCEPWPRQLGPRTDERQRRRPSPLSGGLRPWMPSRARRARSMVNSDRRRSGRSSVRARVLIPQERHAPLGHRAAPGIPRPACRRLLAPVQHRVPGSVPGRDELPRLPQPRRRGPVRGGLHPVARAEPGRGDVLVRLLRAVRAGLPPRRHRSPARDPRDEALPRRVARGVGHPRRHAPDHAARRAGRGRRRRSGRASPSPASSR